ncbi:hypothetical protein, partial [Streptomyces zaomyceticus]|uniref:hypothetical protein n=1 Tax=Streptomyces zaomyceticus TaxID=68286 RepID=UPI0036781B90
PVNPSELEKDPLEEPTLGLQLANTRNGWVITPPLHSFGAFGKTLTKFHTARHGIMPWINYMPELPDDAMPFMGIAAGFGQLHKFRVGLARTESPEVVTKQVRNWLRLLNRIGPDFSDAQALMVSEVLRLGMIIDRMRVADPLGDERSLAPITAVEFGRLLKAFVDRRPQLGGATPEAQQAAFFKEAEEAGSRDPSLGMSSFLAGSHLKPEQAWLFEPAPVPPRPMPSAPTEVLRAIGAIHFKGTGLTKGRIRAMSVLSKLTPLPEKPLSVTSRLLDSWVDRKVLEWWAATVLPDMTADTGGRHLRQLLDLVTRASRAGRVGSLAQIAAFALEEAGVYKRTPGTSVNGHAVVRDFTGRVNGPLKTDQSWIWAEHESGQFTLHREAGLVSARTPWSPSENHQGSQSPRVYMAVVDRGVTDRFRTLGMDHGVAVLVELMLRDKALLNLIRTGLDAVVVVGPYVGAGDRPFQRILAAAVGELVHAAHGAKASEALTVYACDGPMLIERGLEAGELVLIDRRVRGQQRSRWVPAKAADAFPTGYADMEVRTATGRLLKAWELAFHPTLTADGTDVSGWHNASDHLSRKGRPERENSYGDGWKNTDNYVDYYVDAEGLTRVRGAYPLPYLPFGRLVVHGGYGVYDIYGVRHVLKGVDSLVRRRPSMNRLKKAAGSDATVVILLQSCNAATVSPGVDPLLVDPSAVGYAIALNTRVLAAEVITASWNGVKVAKEEDADPRVPVSEWQLVYPMPNHDHLKELVARSKFGDVARTNDVRIRGRFGEGEEDLTPAEVRMLRWIRALRYTLKQHDFGAFGDFGSLQKYLPGIVAMEKLRLSEGVAPKEPLTKAILDDMLKRFSSSHPDPDENSADKPLSRMLTAAARHVVGGAGDGTLSGFLDRPDGERPGSRGSGSEPDGDAGLHRDGPVVHSDDGGDSGSQVAGVGGVVFNSGVGGVVDSGGVDVDVEGVLEAVWGRSVGFAGGVFDRDRLVRRIILHTDDAGVRVERGHVDALSGLVRDRVRASGEGLERLDVEWLEAAY